MTDYLSAVGKVPSYVPPEPVSRESGCADYVHREGNLCGADYETTRTMKPTYFDGCENFTPEEKTPPLPPIPDEVSTLITGLFSDAPVPRHLGSVQCRMNNNASFELRTELEKKQREAVERSTPGEMSVSA